ncbi:hypothetical protein ABVT39_014043 [Epinephelus coioides]
MSSFTMYWYRQKHYGAPVEYLTREYQQNEEHFQSSIDTSKNSFTLKVPGLFLNDSSTYYCAASHSDAHFSFCVKITQPPSVFSREGDSAVSLQCEQDDDQYYNMFWYIQSGAANMQLVTYSLGKESQYNQKCQLNLLEEDLRVSCLVFLHCDNLNEVYFGKGTKLTVLDPDLNVTPPTVKVLHPSKKECKNKRGNAEKTIVCVATRFYPDHVSVSWQVGGEDVSTGVATDNTAQREDKDKYYTITSRLRVSAKDWYNPNTEFKCTVRFFNGTDTEPFSDSIFGDKAKEGVLTREKYLKITQTAKLSYGVFIVKSMVYGVFVAFLVWKLQNSSGKRNH